MARHAVAAVIPLVGAAVLQWLLLQSGATRITRVTDPTASRIVHIWPVWSMVAVAHVFKILNRAGDVALGAGRPRRQGARERG